MHVASTLRICSVPRVRHQLLAGVSRSRNPITTSDIARDEASARWVTPSDLRLGLFLHDYVAEIEQHCTSARCPLHRMSHHYAMSTIIIRETLAYGSLINDPVVTILGRQTAPTTLTAFARQDPS